MSVLVLDNTWQPNRVVSIERAVLLLLAGKATPVTDAIVSVMHSPSTVVHVPAVIVVASALRRNGAHIPPCTRPGIFARDGRVCQFVIGDRPCTSPADSVDHLLPQSRGGRDTWENLVAACRRHNGLKADHTLDEMARSHGWSLRRAPVAPRFALRMMERARIRDIPLAWQPFLAGAA